MSETLFDLEETTCEKCGRDLDDNKNCVWCNMPTRRKSLVQRNDPDTSHAAARSIDVTNLEQMVYDNIVESGSRGMTQDEILSLHPGYSYSSITARPAALKAKGLIGYNGEKRAGASGRLQRVLVAAKFVASESNDSASSSPVPVPTLCDSPGCTRPVTRDIDAGLCTPCADELDE
jgi:hypothetical protein